MRPVLLIEDDLVDARVVQRAFADLSLASPLIHVTTGEKALAYLQVESEQLPCLVLVDLNLPTMSGFDVIKAMQTDEALSWIPIIIITVSENRLDRDMSLGLGAVGYIHKATNYSDVLEAIRTVFENGASSGCPQPSQGAEESSDGLS